MTRTIIATILALALPTGVYANTDSTQNELALQDTRNEEIFAPIDFKFIPQPKEAIDTDRPFKMNYKVDIPILAIGGGWSLYAFTKIYSKDPSTVEQIEALDKNDINGFDRWVAGMHNDKIDKISYYPFYIAMPLPLVLLADKKIRHDFGHVGFLYFESMAITGLLYTGSVYFVDRYRPQTYALEIPVEERTRGGNKNSFFAGHVALVATSGFFIASVYDIYHPNSKLKWWLYGGATALTASMVYLRTVSGNHFPTDQVIGVSVGTLSGLLVPHLHKKKDYAKQAWNLSPFSNGEVSGLSFTYKIR